MGYRQYTHCVQPTDYVDPLPRTESAIETIGAVVDGLLLGGYLPDAILGCDWLLGGKLICLGGDECAIGRITHFEPASDKAFPQNLDNDFSFNILLMPDELNTYATIYKTGPVKDDKETYWQKAFRTATAPARPQGRLLKQQYGMPIPHEDQDIVGDNSITDRFGGVYSEYPDANDPTSYNPNDSPFKVSGNKFRAPALHLEAEGDRVRNVCAVLSALTLGPVGKAICSAKFLGIPFGRIGCHIIGLLLLPWMITAVLAAIAVAWAASRDGDEHDPRTDTRGGDLNYGDLIVATGRWVYDAGHKGWNELHPVKTVQLIDPTVHIDDFSDQRARWCGLLANVPPFVPPGSGPPPTDMTPGQTQVWNSQRQPENQWYLHPEVDGCIRAEVSPRDPILR